ncbi:DUF3568 family protein [Azospira restricta]|uniref:DUF3568 family protein n=1 Tax=Azospira restricta TaxID=404405 RepID=A0A974PX79_9RHOO|nr:DUF3568 family protein [Azospira restricta]QRJ63102.1 DUF3568 family protein [Azospira restricta]
MPIRHFRIALLSLSLLAAGCAPLALTAAGVAGGVTAGHHLGGIAYRTFTEPLPKVRTATRKAMERMAIKPERTEKIANGERIIALVPDRTIEIELESLTPSTTRMRVVAKKDGGVLVDAATAIEVINQTEKFIGSS